MFQSVCKQLTWKKGHVESCRHVKVKVVVWMDADADGWVCLWVIQRWSDYGVLFLSVKSDRDRQTGITQSPYACVVCSMYTLQIHERVGNLRSSSPLDILHIKPRGINVLISFQTRIFPARNTGKRPRWACVRSSYDGGIEILGHSDCTAVQERRVPLGYYFVTWIFDRSQKRCQMSKYNRESEVLIIVHEM